MRCMAYKMFVKLVEMKDKNTLYACLVSHELRSFPPLKLCIAPESGLPLVHDDLLGEIVTALCINRPSRPETDILDVNSGIEAVVPTRVSYENTNLLHTESHMRKQRSGTAPGRIALQRSAKKFCMERDVKQETTELQPVLPALSDKLDGTAEAAENIMQVWNHSVRCTMSFSRT